MPVKFSILDQKDIKDTSYVVGLYDNPTISTGKANCIIPSSTIAKKTEVDSINNKLTNDVVHIDNDETIIGEKTFNKVAHFKNGIEGNGSVAVNGSIELKPSSTSTHGGYIDFHFNGSSEDYTSRIIESTSGTININGTEVYKNGSTRIVKSDTFDGTNFTGTAYRAKWGDLAEFYKSDEQYPKGTLVQFGGEKEITIAKDYVNAVITSTPGYILNDSMEDGQAIALIGRVPVRVIGKVKKFDELNLSDIPGVAEVSECGYSEILALEDKNTEEEGLVLCAVKCSFKRP